MVYKRQADVNRLVAKKEQLTHTQRAWQEDWSPEHRGRLTAKLIKNVSKYVERRHGEVNFLGQTASQ